MYVMSMNPMIPASKNIYFFFFYVCVIGNQYQHLIANELNVNYDQFYMSSIIVNIDL